MDKEELSKDTLEDKYYGTIDVIIPMSVDNFGGCVSISGINKRPYNAILRKDEDEYGEKYTDITHEERIINVITVPQDNTPQMSENGFLYVLRKETLIPLCKNKNKGSKGKH